MPNLTPEIASQKSYLLELLEFFVIKRRSVFGDSDINFTPSEFKNYLSQKGTLENYSENQLSLENLQSHLNCAHNQMYKRNSTREIIHPENPLPLLSYVVNGDAFTINCQTEYLLNALKDTKIHLGLETQEEEPPTLHINRFYVTKNAGKYYYDEDEISFQNPDAEYVKIFMSVVDTKPQGGEILYTDIIASCQRRGLRDITPRKIQSALSGEDARFFRYIHSVEMRHGGIPLFKAQQHGRKLNFNNTK